MMAKVFIGKFKGPKGDAGDRRAHRVSKDHRDRPEKAEQVMNPALLPEC